MEKGHILESQFYKFQIQIVTLQLRTQINSNVMKI